MTNILDIVMLDDGSYRALTPATRARPYRGPVLVATTDEARRIREALAGATDDVARSLLRKCDVVLNSDPKWKLPLK